jgi:hormone-sensitive lipase
LVGDSAGGNLVASLINLLIKWNLPLPSGIVLVYPALNLDLCNYTPSFLTALNDSILPHTFLKICAKSYLSEIDEDKIVNNDLISPICAN